MMQVIFSQRLYPPDAVFCVGCPLTGDIAPFCVRPFPTKEHLLCPNCGAALGTVQFVLGSNAGLFAEEGESTHDVVILPARIWREMNNS